MTDQPNILLIMTDQLNPAFLRSYGHPLVRTPHIDSLAENATVFDAAYCNYPICAPSRFSMLTGRLPSRHGVFDNGCEMPASAPTLMHYLRSIGYHTALAGKMHFLGPDQLHGFEDRVTTDVYPSDFGWAADWRAGTPEIPESPTGINPRSVVEAGPCARSLQIDYDDDVAHQAVQKIFDLARAPQQQPFFLTVSFSHPHNPFVTTTRHWDLYDHAAIDMPAVPPIPPAEMDAHSRRLHHLFRLDEYRVSEEHVRNARHAYYGMISYVDDKVGMLMAALRDARFADNTIVLFTSDHGEMLGERGLWYKQSFLEGSVRVPLMIRLPGAGSGSRRVRQPVSLLDLLPTLLDLATDRRPPDLIEPVEGHSLSPLLSDTDADWPHPVTAEFSAEGTFAPCLMLRRGPFKYIHCETDPPLLFNLDDDPTERSNLAGEPSHSVIERDLQEEMLTIWSPQSYREAVLASQRRQHFLQRALTRGKLHAWDFQPIRDAAQQYVRGGAKTTLVKGRARFPYVEPAEPETPRQ